MVKAGDMVKVRVIDVDIPRKRIGLSMRREPTGESGASTGAGKKAGGEARAPGKPSDRTQSPKEQATSALGSTHERAEEALICANGGVNGIGP